MLWECQAQLYILYLQKRPISFFSNVNNDQIHAVLLELNLSRTCMRVPQLNKTVHTSLCMGPISVCEASISRKALSAGLFAQL